MDRHLRKTFIILSAPQNHSKISEWGQRGLQSSYTLSYKLLLAMGIVGCSTYAEQ